jgi:hypothetical protein
LDNNAYLFDEGNELACSVPIHARDSTQKRSLGGKELGGQHDITE